MTALYRLVYASKNLFDGSEADAKAEVEQILQASRRNNAKADVTGALMFNGGAFAQVLEGPQRGVEDTFERIQRDIRHGDVTVLECGPVAARSFDSWSMAFVGQSSQGRALWSNLATESGFDLGRLNGDAVFAMLHGLVQEEEGVPGAAPSPLPPAEASQQPPQGLDSDRVREEVAQLNHGAGVTGRAMRDPVGALAILKAALADERGRTSALRGEIDELRIALDEAEGRLDGLRAERDLWTERARLLAVALCDDPAEIRRAAREMSSPPTAQRAVA
jgi:hypothetical protein